MTGATGSEFLFAVQLSLIAADGAGTRYHWEANADQRSALATRFGCVEIPRFEVKATIVSLRTDGHFRVSGMVTARVLQNCVVSLVSVITDYETELGLILFPENDGEAYESDDLDDEDQDFEIYSGNVVDLGEIGAIELALVLDSYPRAPGVSVTDLGPGDLKKGYEVSKEGHAGRNRPFEALAALKRKG